MKIAYLSSVVLLTSVLAGCGPREVPTPTPEQVEALIEQAFPGSGATVGQLDRLENEVRAAVELDGADMVLVLQAGEGQWAIAGVEQGETAYTLEELGRIRTTVDLMDAVSDALTSYRDATGAFPALDDLVGLRELVPDHYSGSAEFNDGWGNPLRYRVQGDDYTLTSSGPDGEPATPDDVILVTGRFQQQ